MVDSVKHYVAESDCTLSSISGKLRKQLSLPLGMWKMLHYVVLVFMFHDQNDIGPINTITIDVSRLGIHFPTVDDQAAEAYRIASA